MEIKRGQIVNFTSPQKVENNPVPVKPATVARFKLSRVFTDIVEIPQYSRTGKALIAAGMSLDHLVNAAEGKGDKVERTALDTPSAHNLQGKVGEIIEAADRFQAWQENGEVLITKQLPNPTSAGGVVPFENTEPQKIGVVEGVGVFSDQHPQINNLSDNPYLQAPADLKKAA